MVRTAAERGTWVRPLGAVVLLLVALLAFLALVNSFDVRPAGPSGPGGGPGPRGPWSGPDTGTLGCGEAETLFLVAFAALAAIAAGCGAAAATRRPRTGFLDTAWGSIALVAGILAALALLGWLLVRWSCGHAPDWDCDGVVAFLRTVFLLGLAAGAALWTTAFLRRRRAGGRVFTTAWGIAGTIVLVVAAALGVAWGMVAYACDPPEPQEPDEVRFQTCDERVRDYRVGFFVTAPLAVAAFVVAVARRGHHEGRTLTSPWGVFGIVGLVVAHGFLAAWLILAAICGLRFGCAWMEDTALTYTLVVAAATAVTTVVASVLRARSQGRFTAHPTGAFAVLGMAMTGVGLFLYALALLFCADGDPGGGGGGGDGGDVVVPELPRMALVWLLVAVAVVVAVLLVIMLLRRRALVDSESASAPAPAGQDAGGLERILGGDAPRSDDALVATYRSFLAWSARRGLARRPHETPTEHGRRVAASGDLPADRLMALIDAYEVVRLADRDPTADERRRAGAVRDAFEEDGEA